MSKYVKEVNRCLSKIRNGDESEVLQLVELTTNHLRPIIWRYLSNKTHVEDVLAETFERAYMYINTFDPKRDGFNWLWEIAKNVAYSYNNKEISTVNIDSIPLKDLNDWAKDIESKIDISLAINDLDPKDHEIFYLHFYLQKTYKEIAKEFGISVPAVCQRLRKIYKKIGEKYKKG